MGYTLLYHRSLPIIMMLIGCSLDNAGNQFVDSLYMNPSELQLAQKVFDEMMTRPMA